MGRLSLPAAAPFKVHDAHSVRARRLRTFWAKVGLSRLQVGADGVFAHNICGVSDRDLSRIRELQSAYYRELRAIVASSEPVDHVLLVNLQLIPLTSDSKA